MDRDNHSDELGKSRIEALSDGIFAIAMTLLILEFHVPSLPHNASNVVVVPALLHLWPKFVTYAISFASLGVFWIGHHNMYHAIRRADRMLLWLNIVFFMFASFLPFSTSILNAFMETSVAPLFFGSNLVLLGWILYAQWAYASRQPGMIAPHIDTEYRTAVGTRFLAYPIVAMLTMAVCFWSVSISLAIYLCLLPLYMIPSRNNRQLSERHTQEQEKEPSQGEKTDDAQGREEVSGSLKNSLEQPSVTEAADADSKTRRLLRRVLMQKKMLLGVAAVALIIAGWAAFRPELLFVNQKTEESLPAASANTILQSGVFHGVAHETQGNAAIIQLAGREKVLRLTNFKTSNGPDVRVFLIKAPDATDNSTVTRQGYLEVGRLKGNEGDQSYPLPESADLAKYHAVTIWCNRFHVNFATAPLQ